MVYKNIKTYSNGYLDSGEGHSIYYELSGNPKGKPVLFVHGGPGAGFREEDKRFFNPKIFNVITFDQRGSGRSKPFASLKKNETSFLVEDMRKLLKSLEIEKVILFGGSWGSTLSLVYAIKYPETVKAMVLRGISLGGKDDNNYLIYKAKRHFPDAWSKMLELVPFIYRKKVIKYYYKMMNSKNKDTIEKYTMAWARYEFSISSLSPSEKKIKDILKNIRHEAFSLIELHYLINNCFLPKDYILKNSGKIEKIPASIIHGRYDCVCDPLSAYYLHKKLKNSTLIYTTAGHSASDRENEEALVKEMDKLGKD